MARTPACTARATQAGLAVTCPVTRSNPRMSAKAETLSYHMDGIWGCRAHLEAATPALLRLVCQTLFVTCHGEAEALSKQKPDLAMRQSSIPQQLCRLRICKRLLIAMQVSVSQ